MISSFFFGFSIFFSLVSLIGYQFFGTSLLGEYTAVCIVLSIASLFFPLFRYIQSDTDEKMTPLQKLIFFPIVLLIVGACIFFFHPTTITLLFLSFFFLGFFCLVDARILFLMALLLLIGVVYFLLGDQKSVAEALSIGVYFFLCGWVTLSIVQPSLYRAIQKYIPAARRIPSYMQNYLREIWFFGELISYIFPVCILFFMTLHLTRFAQVFTFDAQFLMTLALLYLCSQVVPRAPGKSERFFIFSVIILWGVLLFLNFSHVGVIWYIAPLLWIGWSIYSLYRGEYVKKLAYRFFSI